MSRMDRVRNEEVNLTGTERELGSRVDQRVSRRFENMERIGKYV